MDFIVGQSGGPRELDHFLSEQLTQSLDRVRTGFHVGESKINGIPCDHLALRTDDCDATHAKALELGATERMAPVSKNIPSIEGDFPVRLSFVFSPTGEIIEFFQNDVT